MPNEWCCMYPGMGHSTWMKYGRRTTVSRSVSPTPEAVVSGPPLSPTPPVLSGVQRGDQERDPSATPTAVRQRYVGVPLSQVESSLRKIPGRKLFEWYSSRQRAAQIVRLNGYHERMERYKGDGVTKRRYKCARCIKQTTVIVNGKRKSIEQRFAPKQGGTHVICKRCKVPLCKKCWPVWHGVDTLMRPTQSDQGSA